MSPLTWHDLYYPSRMRQTPRMRCKHYGSGLNHGTCCCSPSNLILEVSAFMSLQFALVSVVCTRGLYLPAQSMCVSRWRRGSDLCVHVCLSLQVMIWSEVCVCVWLCLRNPPPHLPICPSLSALVAADESPTSLQQVITGLLFCYMETGLSRWYVACLLTPSAWALLLNSVDLFIELATASIGPSFNI